MNELKALKAQLEHEVSFRTPKEQAQADIRFHWMKLQSMMNQLLPFVEQAKLLPGDLIDAQATTWQALRTAMFKLREPYAKEYQRKVESGEIVPKTEEAKEEERETRKAVQAAARERKSDIQSCVDNWVLELLEEYDLKSELLDDDDTESFTYERKETCSEYRSGEVTFTVSDRAKERIEANMDANEDFTDMLKEYLDERIWQDFEVDIDTYDSGDVSESSSELT